MTSLSEMNICLLLLLETLLNKVEKFNINIKYLMFKFFSFFAITKVFAGKKFYFRNFDILYNHSLTFLCVITSFVGAIPRNR